MNYIDNEIAIIGIDVSFPEATTKEQFWNKLLNGRDCVNEISEERLKDLNEDFPGFISNRISHLMINEAAHILHEQSVEAKQIDTVFKQCYGHKMGPLETADLIGLDTIENTLNLLYTYYHEDKFKCCPIISEMVCKGFYGKKAGKGFYNYLRSA